MDTLDPEERRRHAVRLYIGYALLGIVVVLATTILLYLAYGYQLSKNGTVIQNGLIFVSSNPSSANIYLNGAESSSTTNTRLTLPSGSYNMKIERSGYRLWQRNIYVEGGEVEHFDYPFLIPNQLTTTNLATYKQLPPLATQSNDLRWLVIESPDSFTKFEMYDLKNPGTPPTTFTLPSSLLTPAKQQAWRLVSWADDNQHILLEHIYDGNNLEYILVNSQQPSQSVNLTKQLALGDQPYTLQLANNKYNQYFIYLKNGGILESTSLGNTSPPTEILSNVLSYKAYGTNDFLYTTATDSPKTKGEVAVKLLMGGTTYQLTDLPVSSLYLLNLTQYSGVWYVAAGSESANKVYVYQDPSGYMDNNPGQVAKPAAVLQIPQPDYLEFSNNARFILAENKNSFAVYDAENLKTHIYKTTAPMDAPQAHAFWMDGNHLTYISRGKLLMFDFDGANLQTLVPADPAYLPFFSSDYKFVYTLVAPSTKSGTAELTSTSLRTPADQ